MDIEQLTKAQIVLLTLLVSFMTSIATGIVTVTLLDQAPPVVTQNINRIVERTIERVVPAEVSNRGAVASESTVVIKETDLITDSIDRNAKSLVRIFSKSGGSGIGEALVGLGFIVSSGGLLVTDSTLIVEGASYFVITNSGERYNTVIQDIGGGNPTALLRIIRGDENVSFIPITFAQDISVLKLGQTVISLSGSERTNVAIGIVSSLDTHSEGDGGAVTVIDTIQTDLNAQQLLYGSPLVDIFGEVIGVHTVRAQVDGVDGITANYTPITVIQTQVAQFTEPTL